MLGDALATARTKTQAAQRSMGNVREYLYLLPRFMWILYCIKQDILKVTLKQMVRSLQTNQELR